MKQKVSIVSPIFFFFPFCSCGMQKFPGQGSNLCHNSDKAGSLTARLPGNSHLHYLTLYQKYEPIQLGKRKYRHSGKEIKVFGVPVVVQWVKNLTSIMRMRVQSLVLLSGLGNPALPQAVVRSQIQLRSHIAVTVAQASCCISDFIPSLGASICHRCGP